MQQKWWELGGYSALKAVVDAPGFPKSAPFAPQFLESMAIVKDFWAEPSYAQLLLDMQKRVHDYVVADKGTAQQALDLLVKDWTKVFKGAGQRGRRTSSAALLDRCTQGLPGLSSGETPKPAGLRMTTIIQSDDARRSAVSHRAGRRFAPLGARAACRTAAIAWLFITPTIALLLAINIFPLIWMIRLSFTSLNLSMSYLPLRFVGLDNYQSTS